MSDMGSPLIIVLVELIYTQRVQWHSAIVCHMISYGYVREDMFFFDQLFMLI